MSETPIRTTIAGVLIALLAVNQAWGHLAEARTVEEQIIATSPESRVAISTKAGETLRGHVESHTATGFSFKPDKGGDIQTFTYDQVLSVSQLHNRHSHKLLYTAVAVGAAVVVVGVTALVLKNQPVIRY